MTDYIKREDAIRSIIRNDHTDVSKALKRMFAEEMLSYVKDKDAVSIVRCKDCKHCNTDWAMGKWYGSCRVWNTHSVMADWYCVNGERKDNE